ncbi:Uncharacterized protein dnl_58530 [Desulfonema limicola]|uniref:Toxin n=1 Tax=Desulfonema limicola TaxID=45656 RepID=A0A975BDI1_9BACT|nr:toxin [Desulfonema limicola]QTA83446.1 Uncharacterized protein dnl_58530 [Desulfonema limicola]
MKIIWDEAKNNLLKTERGISFEDFVRKIEEGRLLDDIKHPNTDKYPDQKVFIVDMEDDEIILKTAFPSRKMTKKDIGAKK